MDKIRWIEDRIVGLKLAIDAQEINDQGKGFLTTLLEVLDDLTCVVRGLVGDMDERTALAEDLVAIITAQDRAPS